MTLTTTESIWSTMITMRQLSSTYYTITTCLVDLLHRYFDSSQSQINADQTFPSSLLNGLFQSLFSLPSAPAKPADQAKLLGEYTNILQSTLKQNSLHSNIIQNIRRLFRSDVCLTQLFSTVLDEQCQCHECDCTISNSITDVIHDIGELRSTLLVETSQTSCACFRCGDQQQTKNLRFTKFSPCLALTVNHLHATAGDQSTTQLTNQQGDVYDLIYIIELDSTAYCSIRNVYQRQDAEFLKVDGTDVFSRTATIDCRGKLLTLWLSKTTIHSESRQQTIRSESIITIAPPPPQTDSFLSPPQSASSNSQLIPNSTPIDEPSITTDTPPLPYQTSSTITFDDIIMPSNSNDVFDDDTFWDSLGSRDILLSNTDETSSSTKPDDVRSSSPATTTSDAGSTSTNDTVSDLYLTLLNSTNKKSSNSRRDHDVAVNSLATNVLWPMLINRSSRRTKASSSTTTAPSLSSNSSQSNSSTRTLKLLPTKNNKYHRTQPYTTSSNKL